MQLRIAGQSVRKWKGSVGPTLHSRRLTKETLAVDGFDLLAAILRPKAAMFLDEVCTKTIMAMLGINMDKPGYVGNAIIPQRFTDESSL